jgi:1,4-alpha-glucan branching enzyme
MMMNINQAYLFNLGQDHMSYNLLGSRPAADQAGNIGYSFAVWAPAARAVSVAGSFNNWDLSRHPLLPMGTTGIWTGFVPEAQFWDRYKYAITSQSGDIFLKADPYARHSETRPGNASILYDPDDYDWEDEVWMARLQEDAAVYPLNIYEVHLGSWKRQPDGSFMNYRELAAELGAYVRRMGYNAVELLPVMEHPLDDSWGYQVTGYFCVTSRFGTPADFKFLVDHLHSLDIRVILDWVPAHFPRDAHGLARFDGSALYEYADRRIGEHQEWGTYVFDYGKCEVRSFLLSSAWFWLHEFHADGLRVDAVSSMLYRDYGRTEYLPNISGGTDNIEAISFLRELNSLIRAQKPGCLMIAEESTSWAKVSRPAGEGGLGFTHKWDMGWMHDTLDYMSRDYCFRKWHHHQLSFSMMYAFSERFVLPLSHDETVHGKRSLIERMPGDDWRKFACLRALFVYQMTHPGGKLMFMGGEFGQFIEWRFYEQLEWFLLEIANHRQLQDFTGTLNHYYLDQPALWQQDGNWSGFIWISADDSENSVYTYMRRAQSDSRDDPGYRIVILNMMPDPRPAYCLGVPIPGPYQVDLNSDAPVFGGSGYPVTAAGGQVVMAETVPSHRQPARLVLDLPPLCGLILRAAPAADLPSSKE